MKGKPRYYKSCPHCGRYVHDVKPMLNVMLAAAVPYIIGKIIERECQCHTSRWQHFKKAVLP